MQHLTSKWFDVTAMEEDLLSLINELRLPPSIALRSFGPLPNKLWSTTKYPGSLPFYWRVWSNRLADLDVSILDEEGMEAVMESLAGERMRGIWDVLPKPVMKSDLIRYLLLLLEGGIYSDVDTEPLCDPSFWGSDAVDYLPSSLSNLTRSQSRDPTLAASLNRTIHVDLDEEQTARAGGSIDDPDIAVVIGIEADSFTTGLHPGWGYQWPIISGDTVRATQMAQWTMMARPLHPIFLDAVVSVMENVEEAIEFSRMDGSIPILELTGPGPFTDAVFRYLLARHGVSPMDIVNKQSTRRIGDVLILEADSLGWQPETRRGWNSKEAQLHPVCHYYAGEWKANVGDPWM